MDAQTAAAKLTLIQDRERSRRKAFLEWEQAKTIAKDKKGVLDRIEDDLHEEITSQQTALPFTPAEPRAPEAVDQTIEETLGAETATAVAEPPSDAKPEGTTAWKKMAVKPEVHKLQARPWKTLQSMDLDTLGALVDYINAGNELKDLPGWSEKLANTVLGAIEEWFEKHPEAVYDEE